MGRGREGAGRDGSKKSKPIPAPPRGVGLKSRPIPAPSPLRGGENPHGAKRGGAGQAGRGKIAIPSRIEVQSRLNSDVSFNFSFIFINFLFLINKMCVAQWFVCWTCYFTC